MSPGPKFCRICKKDFISERAYKLHLKFRHQNESVPKEETKAKAKNHQCSLCKQSFQDYSKYQCHIMSKHKNVRFQCQRCDKSFIWRHHLDEHSEIHGENGSTNQSQSMNDDEEQAPKPKSNKCDFCDKEYVRLGNLQKHIKTIHYNKKSKA